MRTCISTWVIALAVMLAGCSAIETSYNVPYVPDIPNPSGETSLLKLSEYVHVSHIDGVRDAKMIMAAKGQVGYLQVPSGLRTLTVGTYSPGWQSATVKVRFYLEPGRNYYFFTLGIQHAGQFTFDYYLEDMDSGEPVEFMFVD